MKAIATILVVIVAFASGYAIANRTGPAALPQRPAQQPQQPPANPELAPGTPGPGPVPTRGERVDPTKVTRDQQRKLNQRYVMAGTEHLQMAGMAGEWKVTMTLTQQGNPTETSTGFSTLETIASGRFLLEKFNGTIAGSDFVGLGILGYDRIARVFTSVWVDNTGTVTHFAMGARKTDGTYVLRGNKRDHHDPLGHPFRTEVLAEKDTMVKKIYDTVDGAEVLVLEMQYQRR